jgi:hypothetical protein
VLSVQDGRRPPQGGWPSISELTVLAPGTASMEDVENRLKITI